MNEFSRERVKGFLHTDGRWMVNGDGERVVLRGWGAGNWANPEGFMVGAQPIFGGGLEFGKFSLPGRFDRGRTMDQAIRELCGSEYAKNFWPKWMRNHLAEEDIRAMAEQGYNSVRLPVSSWLFLPEEPEIRFNEDSFDMLTQVLDWCEKYRIYAIIDMHGAPGGQSALPCDDGLDNVPHLFLEPESRERAILLWEELAKRYHDRWIVGGYDLLNEPLSGPGWEHLIPELARFYDEVISRIRKIDRNHMMTVEGAGFSMDMEIFDHDYDPECHNWCIHTHYYGFSPEPRDLYRFLDSSLRCNVPVWIGEGGSDPVANSVFYEMAARYGMGYALWSWKAAQDKDGKSMGAVSYPLPEGWDAVSDYISKGGPRPSYQEAGRIFDEMLESIRFEHCTVKAQDANYNLRQPGIKLPAAGFDHSPERGEACRGIWKYGNVFGFRTEENMKLVQKPGAKPPRKVVIPGTGQGEKPAPLTELWLELTTGEFVTYTIRNVKQDCRVVLTARGLSTSGAWLQVTAGGRIQELSLPASEEVRQYMAVTLPPAEEYAVKLEMAEGIAQIADICFQTEESEETII